MAFSTLNNDVYHCTNNFKNILLSDEKSQIVEKQVSNQSIVSNPPKKDYPLNVTVLNDKNGDQFFSIYRYFFRNFCFDFPQFGNGCVYMREDFASVKECKVQWPLLDVQLPIDQIRQILYKTGIMQLRPIDENCRILVVGCGNGPIANAAGYALTNKDDDAYQEQHAHHNAITINPHLATNPTLVGVFGAQKFPMLDDGQFDLIVIEGTSISDTEIGRLELERLRNPEGGQVVVNLGDKSGKKFSWEDNAANCWDEEYQAPEVVIEDLNIYESFNYQEDAGNSIPDENVIENSNVS